MECKRESGALELESQAILSHPVWMLGTKVIFESKYVFLTADLSPIYIYMCVYTNLYIYIGLRYIYNQLRPIAKILKGDLLKM